MMKSKNSMHIEIDGITFYAEAYGCEINSNQRIETDKPVLIAIPGGPGFSHTFLKPGLNPVSDYYPLIYIDPRGTGKSSPSCHEKWTIQQHASDLLALVDSLGIKQPVFFGHSAGAHYAAAAAKLAPDYVAGLLLSNCVSASKAKLFENIIRLGGNVAKRLMIDLDAEGFPEYAEKVLPKYDPITRPLEHAASLEANIEQCMFMLHECFDTNLLEMVSESKVRSLIMPGRMDPLDPAEDVIPRVSALENNAISYLEFEESGHDNLMCEPKKMIQAITQFMGTI